MKREKSSTSALALGLIVMTMFGQCYGQLELGFYVGKCSRGRNMEVHVEQLIFEIVDLAFSRDPTLAAAMLRMLFHDCFVRGCDASLLLDGENSEKTAGPNLTVRGYELIDNVKAAVERRCRRVVSCADIIVIVTRVTVYLASGRTNWYEVKTGRRDGTTSIAGEANENLPSPFEPVPGAIAKFQAKNLSVEDFVLLMGGHTVGISQCGNFQSRLYNFGGINGRTDPSMDQGFSQFLKNICPQNGSGGNVTVLDNITPSLVDNGFYQAILLRRGVLQIDQDMAFDPITGPIVSQLATGGDFNHRFGLALNNLAEIEVLTGSQGQIRRSCRRATRN